MRLPCAAPRAYPTHTPRPPHPTPAIAPTIAPTSRSPQVVPLGLQQPPAQGHLQRAHPRPPGPVQVLWVPRRVQRQMANKHARTCTRTDEGIHLLPHASTPTLSNTCGSATVCFACAPHRTAHRSSTVHCLLPSHPPRSAPQGEPEHRIQGPPHAEEGRGRPTGDGAWILSSQPPRCEGSKGHPAVRTHLIVNGCGGGVWVWSWYALEGKHVRGGVWSVYAFEGKHVQGGVWVQQWLAGTVAVRLGPRAAAWIRQRLRWGVGQLAMITWPCEALTLSSVKRHWDVFNRVDKDVCFQQLSSPLASRLSTRNHVPKPNQVTTASLPAPAAFGLLPGPLLAPPATFPQLPLRRSPIKRGLPLATIRPLPTPTMLPHPRVPRPQPRLTLPALPSPTPLDALPAPPAPPIHALAALPLHARPP